MSTAHRLVRVAVEAVADRPERTFSYRMPAVLGDPAPGSLLLVPYGRRLALGYLVGQAGEAVESEIRDVEAVVSEPMLTPDLLDLAAAIATYYRAPIGTTIAAMLPPGLESRLERRWEVLDRTALPDAGDEPLGDAELLRHQPVGGGRRWLEQIRRNGVVRAQWSLRQPELGARRVRVLRSLPGEHAPPRRAPLQRALLDALGGGERTLVELADELHVAAGSLLGPARRLAAAGHAALTWREVARDPLAHRSVAPAVARELVDEQQRAVAAIERLAPGGELLLEGVAAAGKTDVYLAALASTLAAGRSAIVLVPELSLVPQVADRLAALVGDELAALHSGLSAGERHDEWWRILRGEARVVVGTRTAVFAPLAELGLIVVDEAHDGGYKSDRTPRYDARWVARQRAAATGARLVLGTATPEVTTMARMRGGLIERARLVERRVGSVPQVQVIDLRAELAEGNRSIFSRSLDACAGRACAGGASRRSCSSTDAAPPPSSCAATAARACAVRTATCPSCFT